MKKIIIVLIFLIGLQTADVFSNEKAGTGSISGKIMIRDSGPMADGTVLFFNDAKGPVPNEKLYMRAPEIIANTDTEGRFSITLPEGKYYIGGKKHLTGKWNGPPREGDLFFISMDETEMPKAYLLSKGDSISVNIESGNTPYARPDSMDGITAIEGIVSDINGNPVEDVVVFAYLTSVMGEELAFVSDYTENDGRYMLRVHEGGIYFLMVMGKFGTVTQNSGMIINYDSKEITDVLDVTSGKIKKDVNVKLERSR